MKKYRTFRSFKEIILKKFNDNNSVLDECTLSNNLRLYYLSIIAIPLRIIILFTFNESYDTLVMKTWSQGIITSHLTLLIFMIGFFMTMLWRFF